MIDYKLVKKLKKAGFPFTESAIELDDIGVPEEGEVISGYIRIDGRWLIIPILSELIEACGDGRGSSWFQLTGGFTHDYDYGWKASFNTNSRDMVNSVSGLGKTPEEAVARLWLELNEN